MRAKNEGARRDGERARLETLAEAAREEAEGRGEELARAVMEFESRAVCAEGQMSEKVRYLASVWRVIDYKLLLLGVSLFHTCFFFF